MSRVVERCTVCGTEHSLIHSGPCEACGGDLGFWCTRHEAEAGWLPGRTCPLCAREGAARAAPPPPRPESPPPSTRPSPPSREAPRPRARPPVDVPFEELPPRRPPPVDAPFEAAPPPRRRSRRPVEAGPPVPPPGPVLRDEVARHLPGIAAGGVSLAWRLLMGFLAVIRAVLGWGIIGAVLGVVYGMSTTGSTLQELDPQLFWTGAFGAMVGGGLGLLIGLVRALRILFASPRE